MQTESVVRHQEYTPLSSPNVKPSRRTFGRPPANNTRSDAMAETDHTANNMANEIDPFPVLMFMRRKRFVIPSIAAIVVPTRAPRRALLAATLPRKLLLAVYTVENVAQQRFVGNYPSQRNQACMVLRFGNPEFQITAFGIFFEQVVLETAVLILFVQLRIIGQPVLNSPAEGCFGIDDTVGFGHNAPVDGARRMAG